MRRQGLCSANAAKCDDCKHWEPMPFHNNGGACVCSEDTTAVRPYIGKGRSMTDKGPWPYFRKLTGSCGATPSNQDEGPRDRDNWTDVRALPIRDDIVLKKRIARALSRNPNIDERQISIQVKDSVVQLRGIVGSVTEKRLAEERARTAPGVKEVINSIRVISAVYRTDVQIVGEILRCLSLCLGLNLSQVSVEVRNAIAFLGGTVRSDRLKSAVEEIIVSMPYVAQVVNHLQVSDL